MTTRSLTSDSPRYAVFAWLLAGILLAGWLAWFCFGSVTVYEISSRARLEVRNASHPVATLIPSKVVSTALVIGKEVEAGDVLVELDASSETLRLKEEEARLDAIPGRIASLEREIEVRQHAKTDDLQAAAAAADGIRSRTKEAEAAVDFAKDNERRLAKLNAGGWATTVDATRAATETQKLSATRDAILSDFRKAEWDAQSRAHQHDADIEALRRSVVSLEGDAATSRATIARLKVDIEKHRVRAPISGKIGDVVPLPPGAYVAEGQRLATLVPSGDLIIVADFAPSLTLGRVRPGQQAELRLDGFPWAQFGTVAAHVTRVASEIRDNFVRVEFAIDERPTNGIILQHGLPGSIEVNVEQASPGALVLRAAGLLLSSPTRDPATIVGLAR
jgi:multidrug resistance efflux pump